MTDFNQYVKEKLKDPAIKAAYDAMEPEFTIIQTLVDARKNCGLTQQELSKRTGIAQSDISKLENGNANPSIKTLQKLATALDKKLEIKFVS
jgi:predicted transcriptional regulator